MQRKIMMDYNAGDAKLCDNYRPISLVNTLSKILEKIVAIKLTNHLQINDLLYKHQYGFQKGKSTEHNLIQVVNFIANALNNGNFCIGVFLDLKKAFDVCDHGILLKKLKNLELSTKHMIGSVVIYVTEFKKWILKVNYRILRQLTSLYYREQH